jgi:hypothetical protein
LNGTSGITPTSACWSWAAGVTGPAAGKISTNNGVISSSTSVFYISDDDKNLSDVSGYLTGLSLNSVLSFYVGFCVYTYSLTSNTDNGSYHTLNVSYIHSPCSTGTTPSANQEVCLLSNPPGQNGSSGSSGSSGTSGTSGFSGSSGTSGFSGSSGTSGFSGSSGTSGTSGSSGSSGTSGSSGSSGSSGTSGTSGTSGVSLTSEIASYYVKLLFSSGSLIGSNGVYPTATCFEEAEGPEGNNLLGATGWTFTKNGTNEITIAHNTSKFAVNFTRVVENTTGNFLTASIGVASNTGNYITQVTARNSINIKGLTNSFTGISSAASGSGSGPSGEWIFWISWSFPSNTF